MPNHRPVMKLRRLPDGVATAAEEAGWQGSVLHLEIADGQPGLTTGALVEIESEANLYLGQVTYCDGPSLKIQVEHSLDRARLASLQGTWR